MLKTLKRFRLDTGSGSQGDLESESTFMRVRCLELTARRLLFISSGDWYFLLLRLNLYITLA